MTVATFKKMAAQGELLFEYIKTLPPDLTEITPDGTDVIVGHSETGHHHVMSVGKVRHFRDPKDEFTTYLQISEHDVLRHLRPHATHEPLGFRPGVVRVRHQREYVPEGWRRAVD